MVATPPPGPRLCFRRTQGCSLHSPVSEPGKRFNTGDTFMLDGCRAAPRRPVSLRPAPGAGEKRLILSRHSDH